MARKAYSIVEYTGARRCGRCGYCKQSSTKYSHGMWAHSLNVEDYQALIDRGWRRSGHYCYKPTMRRTCCPQYPIRCHAKSFRFSKSKKKVAKRMRQFLLSEGESEIESWKQRCKYRASASHTSDISGDTQEGRNNKIPDSKPTVEEEPETSTTVLVKEVRKGDGPDPTKPPCRKAKKIRMERKLQKINEKDSSSTSQLSSSKSSEPGSLQSLLAHISPDANAKHKLEVRLVRVDSPEFRRTRKESLKLYQKYQCTIHNDAPSDCDEKQWQRFLVDSPLNFHAVGPGQGFGSFHNQYWLDDKLIAVGVVDVLPMCVSSVYLYYDPDYGFLSLGVYSAISEIALVNQLQAQCCSLEYYYMGFYIHSCSKMRYKGAYDPSDLLCPEVYCWVPIDKCRAMLETTSYARLNVLNGGSADDSDSEGRMDSLDTVLCLYRRQIVPYGVFKQKCLAIESRENSELEVEDAQVGEYASLVGQTCAERMLLFRSGLD